MTKGRNLHCIARSVPPLRRFYPFAAFVAALFALLARRFLRISDHGLGSCIVRVHQQGDHASLGNQLG